jgi:NADP-dependent 3-hydroxy acid dehydrogenase YdfG
MGEFEESLVGAVAVITGGASGMGKAFAERFGSAGCRLVLADIEEAALARTVSDLSTAGTEVLGVPTDVSDADSMDALANATFERFGQVDLLFNNAGVGGGGTIDTLTTADWAWILGVNLWGVIHGLRVFLPHLIERNSGYIVNTASVAGHTSYARIGPYSASKHAVVSISETLYAELHQQDSAVRVAVLCPGLVSTNIMDSERNRPERLNQPLIADEDDEALEALRAVTHEIYSHALDPSIVATKVYEAIREGQFYIWTDAAFDGAIARRHADIQQGRNPSNMGSVISPEEPVN